MEEKFCETLFDEKITESFEVSIKYFMTSFAHNSVTVFIEML